MQPLRAVPRLLSFLGVPRLAIASVQGLDAYLREQLESNVRWHERAGSGAWICPFCLAAVGVGSTLRDTVEDHLAVHCGPFGAGWDADRGP